MILKYEIPVDIAVEGQLTRLSISGAVETEAPIAITVQELYKEGILKIKENIPKGAQIIHLGFEDLEGEKDNVQ